MTSSKKYSVIWHFFDIDEEGSYPSIESTVKIQCADGRLIEGSSRELFSPRHLQEEPRIVGWRYVRL
jgi:hypothetical protein